MARKYRKCPYCGGIKGFVVTYQIKGNGSEIRTFKGKVFDAQRELVDDLDPYAYCLDCGKGIDIEKLDAS